VPTDKDAKSDKIVRRAGTYSNKGKFRVRATETGSRQFGGSHSVHDSGVCSGQEPDTAYLASCVHMGISSVGSRVNQVLKRCNRPRAWAHTMRIEGVAGRLVMVTVCWVAHRAREPSGRSRPGCLVKAAARSAALGTIVCDCC
jgi:hypothetical protein